MTDIPFFPPGDRKKFGSRELDSYAHDIFMALRDYQPSQRFVFHLNDLEWISHEVLVFLNALLYHLKDRRIPFYVSLYPNDITPRKTRNLIRLWEIWKIGNIVDFDEKMKTTPYDRYFDIDSNKIQRLKEKVGIDQERSLVYTWHRITPFLRLDANKLNDTTIKTKIDDIYTFEKYTASLLNEYNSNTPITNKTLSHTITRELYENSIEHAFSDQEIANGKCYMGVSLHHKLKLDVERMNAENFSEWIPEAMHFLQGPDRKFRNFSFLQFTFIDFGNGIPASLRDTYIAQNDKAHDDENTVTDNDVLEYAFDYSSSRFPITERLDNRNSISRGLYDMLVIVERYKGLVMARSNNGKILFDFSQPHTTIKECTKFFGSKDHFFDGTIISIYIPENTVGISLAPIKPIKGEISIKSESQYLSVLELEREVGPEKQYQNKIAFINELLLKIENRLRQLETKNCTLYIDFAGNQNNYSGFEKIMKFLASAYYINPSLTVVIINPPPKEVLDTVHLLISTGMKANPSLHYHVIPCIYNIHSNDYEIVWMGIDNNKQYVKYLSDLLINSGHKQDRYEFEIRQDEKMFSQIQSHIFSDGSGNLVKHIGDLDNIAIESLSAKCTQKTEDAIFLAAGNYFQEEFTSFIECLQDEQYADFISTHLFNEVKQSEISFNFDHLVSITLSSQLIGRGFYDKLKQENINSKIHHTRLSSYHTFEREKAFKKIKKGQKVALVCDVVSTGFLIKKFYEALKANEARLVCVIAVMDSRYEDTGLNDNLVKCFYDLDKRKYEKSDDRSNKVEIIVLQKKPVEKYRTNIARKKVIRINPITNAQNTLSIVESEKHKILHEDIEQLFANVSRLEDYFHIGFIENNSQIHSYFIDLSKLLREQSASIFKHLIEEVRIHEQSRIRTEPQAKDISRLSFINYHLRKLKTKYQDNDGLYKALNDIDLKMNDFEAELDRLSLSVDEKVPDVDIILYPVFSGIDEIEHTKLKNLFGGLNIGVYPLARVNTNSGWRFTIPPKFLNEVLAGKNVMLLDDGSCTGNTIVQMISSISYYEVRRIVVLSLISRIENFQREFLTRIQEMKVKQQTREKEGITSETPNQLNVPLHIYFGTHLHIPVLNRELNNYFDSFKERMNLYLQIPNLPDETRLYITKFLTQLEIVEAETITERKDAEYLPIDKSTGHPPYLQLFKYRNILGRLQGYRFFEQYFDEIDNIKNQTGDLTSDKFQTEMLECILATIIHENYLLEILKNLTPDLLEKLKMLLDLIFRHRRLSMQHLKYEWKKNTLVKAFLIINIDKEKLSTELKDTIWDILDIIGDDDTSLHYLSFFLFNHIAHTRNEVPLKRQSNDTYSLIQEIRKAIVEKNTFSKKVLNTFLHLEFYCILNPYTLSGTTFEYACDILHRFYTFNEIQGKEHKLLESKSAILLSNLQFLSTLTDSTEEADEEAEIVKNIRETWQDTIKPSIVTVLKYSKVIKEVFQLYDSPKYYDPLFGTRDSLEKSIARIETIFENDDTRYNSDELEKIFTFIHNNILFEGSVFKSFYSSYRADVQNVAERSLRNLIRNGRIKYENKIREATYSLIHGNIAADVFFRQIASNIEKHSDPDVPSTCLWEKENGFYVFRLKSTKNNAIQEEYHTKSGIRKMKDIAAFYNTEITTDETNEFFEMTIKFISN